MATKKQSKKELFLELAQPDKDGCSRWVNVTEFVGKYSVLVMGNGCDWGRKNSPLRQAYILEMDKSITPGNRVDRVRLKGFNRNDSFSQAIRKDICDEIRKRRCVMLGINGKSENTIIEVDHKDERKNDMRVSDMSTQQIDDFQPLCKAANDIKRQICKNCTQSDKRWDARNIEGNPYGFYEGDERYNGTCVGCYQYDPVEYRKRSALRIIEESSKHTAQYIMEKLYPSITHKK